MDRVFRKQPYGAPKKKMPRKGSPEMQQIETRLGPPAQYEPGSVAEALQRTIAERMSGIKKGPVRRIRPIR